MTVLQGEMLIAGFTFVRVPLFAPGEIGPLAKESVGAVRE